MKIRILVALTVLCLGIDGTCWAQRDPAASPKVAEDEPIIVDEEPEAFFVEAPWTLARRMRGALKAACAGSAGTSIFCDGTPLRFLREVSVYGNRKGFGFACSKDSLYARNKYFTAEDIRSKDSCLWINCPSGYSCEVDPTGIGKVKGNA
jgi:hypothetical protein